MDSPPPSDVEVPSMLSQLEGHLKVLIPLWNSSKELSKRCGELVEKVEQKYGNQNVPNHLYKGLWSFMTNLGAKRWWRFLLDFIQCWLRH